MSPETQSNGQGNTELKAFRATFTAKNGRTARVMIKAPTYSDAQDAAYAMSNHYSGTEKALRGNYLKSLDEVN